MKMEWKNHPSFLQILRCILLYPYVGSTSTSPDELLQASSTLSSPIPCYVDFHTKSAQCDRRNFKYLPRYLPDDIRILDLSHNKLHTLRNNSFRTRTLLVELDLSHNNITFIETSTFHPLEHLRELNLAANMNLNIIQNDIFRGFVNLQLLDLTACQLKVFPNDSFRWLPRLEKLSLKKNPISYINTTTCPNKRIQFFDLSETLFEVVTNDTFTFTCTCDALLFHSNMLRIVDPNVIASLHVRTLSIGLGSNQVKIANTTQVYNDLFAGVARSSIQGLNVITFDARAYKTVGQLRNKSLFVFELESSNLYLNLGMNQTIFQSLPRVTKMHISRSNIGTLRPTFFRGMAELFELNLSNNRIRHINASRSHWNIYLYSLDLSANSLYEVGTNSLGGLSNLSTLDLSNNRRLYYFSLSLSNLKYLNISGTAIAKCSALTAPNLISFSFSGRLPREFVTATFFKNLKRFQNMSLIQEIDLRNSKIQLFELFDSLGRRSLFDGLNSLTSLYLPINDIRSLQSGIFAQLSSLSELNLSQCKISYIEQTVFKALHSLTKLHLDNNQIFSLPPSLFSTTSRLKVLYLHQNILSYLVDDLFLKTSIMTNLTLSRNELITLNQSTLTPIKASLQTIDLSENPFECSCQLKWLIEWLRDSNDTLQINKATCSPSLDSALKGKSLSSIDPTNLCRSYMALYLSTPFVAIALLVIIAIIHHYRWLFKYKIFLLRLAVLGYIEIQDVCDQMNFQFDLNIVFTGDNEKWATEYLRPNLEEQLPQFQRIAFGDDNLPLNMYYLDAVLYTIEHSFKSILLLSKAATQDNEFMMKLRIALNHMANTQIESTVLVFLENIPEEEMPYLVKLYLSEQRPYITWVEDERGQRYFWKQLTKTLTMSLIDFDMALE